MLRAKFELTRSNQITEMLQTSVPPWFVAALLTAVLTGCGRKTGAAVVLAKEHIDAALPTTETPNAQPGSSPDAQLRPMAGDEIAVDGYQ
jgi:hypothetical protein